MPKSRRKIVSTDIYRKKVFIFNLRVDFRSRLTMSSGLALGCGSPPSIISSKARLTLATFSSKTCACAESRKKANKSHGKATQSIVSSKARLTLTTFYSKTCAYEESGKKVNNSLGTATQSIICSKARLTLATFSSKTCACVESSKKSTRALEMQHSIHLQLKGQAHIGHLLFKNLRMRGEL
jgi:hypothetical protein